MNASSRKSLRRYPMNPIELLSTLAMGALLIWAIQPLRIDAPASEGHHPVLTDAKLDATFSGRTLASRQNAGASERYPTIILDCGAASAVLNTDAATARVRFSGECSVESLSIKDATNDRRREVALFPQEGHFVSAYAPLRNSETIFEFSVVHADGKRQTLTRRIVR